MNTDPWDAADEHEVFTVTTSNVSRCTGTRLVKLRAVGDIDLCSVERLTEQLDLALTAGAEEVIVDLTAVTFMAACGIRALQMAADNARARGIQFSVVITGRRLVRVFELTGVTDKLRVLTSAL